MSGKLTVLVTGATGKQAAIWCGNCSPAGTRFAR